MTCQIFEGWLNNCFVLELKVTYKKTQKELKIWNNLCNTISLIQGQGIISTFKSYYISVKLESQH